MLKRKINAGVSLLTTVILLLHAILLSIWILSGGRTTKPVGVMGWVLMGFVIAHALISIDLALSAHSETQTRKGKSYPKMNVSTIVQRFSGMFLLPTTGLHIAGATGAITQSAVAHIIVAPLFFTIVLSHIALSASKALITLGIGNATFIKVADIVVKVLCGATLVASVTAIYFRTFTEGAA